MADCAAGRTRRAVAARQRCRGWQRRSPLASTGARGPGLASQRRPRLSQADRSAGRAYPGERRRQAGDPCDARRVEHAGELAFSNRQHVGHGDGPASLGRQRGDGGVRRCRTARSGRTRTGRSRSSARSRASSRPWRPGCPRAAILRSGLPCPSPGSQAPLRPSTRPAGTPKSAHTPIMASSSQSDIADDVDRLVQRDDRIADKLAGAMPGDLAAAVDVDDRRARIADRPVERAGALAGRIDGLVLKQQARVGDLARARADRAPGAAGPRLRRSRLRRCPSPAGRTLAHYAQRQLTHEQRTVQPSSRRDIA